MELYHVRRKKVNKKPCKIDFIPFSAENAPFCRKRGKKKDGAIDRRKGVCYAFTKQKARTYKGDFFMVCAEANTIRNETEEKTP